MRAWGLTSFLHRTMAHGEYRKSMTLTPDPESSLPQEKKSGNSLNSLMRHLPWGHDRQGSTKIPQAFVHLRLLVPRTERSILCKHSGLLSHTAEQAHQHISPRVNTYRQHTHITCPFQGLTSSSWSSFAQLMQLLWLVTGDNRSRVKHGFHPSCDQWVTRKQ